MFLAAALHAKGRKVAVFDMDPQLSATRWRDQCGELPFPVVEATSETSFRSWLRRSSGADYILVDTPPGTGHLIDKAVAVASLILVPTGVLLQFGGGGALKLVVAGIINPVA